MFLLYSNLLYTISSINDVQTLLRSAELYTVYVVVLHGTVLLGLSLIDARGAHLETE